MADRAKGIIVGNNNILWKSFQAELSQVVEFVEKFDDCATSYTSIKNLGPETIFIDIDIDLKGGIALAEQLKNSMPGTALFFVSQKKDPDIILAGLKAGIDDFLLLPGNGKELSSSVQKALGRIESGGRSGKITAILSIKGGQGVTSIATNLADQIYLLSKDRVILVDMNLFMGDVSVFLEFPSTYTIFDMLKDIERMDENLLFSSLNRHDRGFYILAAPDEVSDADQVSGEDITRILSILSAHFDHIIIDLPHNFSEKNLAVIDAADTLFLLVQQSTPVIKSVQNALNFFEELGYDETRIKILLNRYLEKSELTKNDISYVLNQPVYACIKNDFASLSEAINKGKTLDMANPDALINRDMETIAGLLTGIKPEQKVVRGRLSHMISRILPL